MVFLTAVGLINEARLQTPFISLSINIYIDFLAPSDSKNKSFDIAECVYLHPLIVNRRRKYPHFPRRGQKKLNPNRPQLVGVLSDVEVGVEDAG